MAMSRSSYGFIYHDKYEWDVYVISSEWLSRFQMLYIEPIDVHHRDGNDRNKTADCFPQCLSRIVL